MAQQIALHEPQRKSLWKQIVQAKIGHQASILQQHGGDPAVLARLHSYQQRVKSGDPDNMEAQAARLYWPSLMGEAFRRDQEAFGINAALNYGYAVLRAATARAVVATGLTPALGLHHCNAGDAFALADDVMEPWRPLVDDVVCSLRNNYGEKFPSVLSSADKKQLVAVLLRDCYGQNTVSPLVTVLQTVARSLVQCLGDRDAPFVIPTVLPPDVMP